MRDTSEYIWVSQIKHFMYTSGTSKLELSRILCSPFAEGALLVLELPTKVCSVLPCDVSLGCVRSAGEQSKGMNKSIGSEDG